MTIILQQYCKFFRISFYRISFTLQKANGLNHPQQWHCLHPLTTASSATDTPTTPVTPTSTLSSASFLLHNTLFHQSIMAVFPKYQIPPIPTTLSSKSIHFSELLYQLPISTYISDPQLTLQFTLLLHIRPFSLKHSQKTNLSRLLNLQISN